jgi:ATP-binding cassette subfamily C protein CydC
MMRQQLRRERIESSFRGLGVLSALVGAALALACLAGANPASLAVSTGAALSLIAAFEAASAMVKALDAAPRAEAAARRLGARLTAPPCPREPQTQDADKLESVLPIAARDIVIAPADSTPGISVADFSIEAGQVLEVTGPSGCGKTTFAETLMRLQPLRAGSLTYADAAFDAVRSSAVLAYIALSPQFPAFLPGALRAQFLLARPDASDAAIFDALALACVADVVRARPRGLDALLDSDGGGFSGGELRRIGIARAVLAAPQVLILDEPFTGLEAGLARRLSRNLSTWAAEGGRALVVLQHEPGEYVWPGLMRRVLMLSSDVDMQRR